MQPPRVVKKYCNIIFFLKESFISIPQGIRMNKLLYIVKAGDTLKSISLNCMGNSAKYQQIAKLNHLNYSSQLHQGQVLNLPLENSIFNPPCSPPFLNKREYIVSYGDTLWSISKKYLRNPSRWLEIAQLNQLSNPDHIFVGQTLILPRDAYKNPDTSHIRQPTHSMSYLPQYRPATMVPVRSLFFVITDEFNPLRQKYVRKVIFPKDLQGNPELTKQILRPDKYGFSPRDPTSNISIGRHVLGRTDSNFISFSELPKGSPRFDGKPYWIDVKKLQASGTTIHDIDDIMKDLDRIAKKTKNPEFLSYIADIKHKSSVIDKETLAQGPISPQFIKGARAKALTGTMRFVGGVGIVLTTYDVGNAAYISYDRGTPKPLIAETVRQVGGWGSAFAGFKIGAAIGGALGIETGPGALLAAGAGGFVFGAVGYFGADWIANYIYDEKNG